MKTCKDRLLLVVFLFSMALWAAGSFTGDGSREVVGLTFALLASAIWVWEGE